MKYETNDHVLPILDLPDPCPVRLRIAEDIVVLRIGPRDISWSRATGNVLGAGTILAPARDE